MLNKYHVDTERSHENDIKQLIARGRKDEGRGGQTVRFIAPPLVIKAPKSKKSLFSFEIARKNLEVLASTGVNFPEATIGVYDLSDVGLGTQTPALMQRMAKKDFYSTLKDGKATKETYQLLKGAIKQVDRCAKKGIKIDSSLSNFGLFDGTVAYMDVQDKHSVGKGSEEELREMYNSLKTSMAYRDRQNRERVLGFIEKHSEVV